MRKLVESTVTGKILQHMNHTEDLILEGKDACDYVYQTLEGVFEALEGNTKESKVSISQKWDGAPCVICSSDFHGMTFVTTKHAFNSKTKALRKEKVAFSQEELSNVSSTSEVQEKLKLLFESLPYIDIPKDEIWMGDFLFSNKDLRKEEIEGEECVVFQPNTIAYAIPSSDPLAKRIEKSLFGVVWHTKYTGDSFEDLKLDFHIDISKVNQVPNIFQIDANLPSIAGIVTMTEEETLKAKNALLKIKKDLSKLEESDFYHRLDENYILYLNTYRNALIRFNNQQPDPSGFKKWLGLRYDSIIDQKKTTKAKEEWSRRKDEILNRLPDSSLSFLYELQDEIRILKEFFVEKLNGFSTIKTYLKYKDKGYKRANAEGYAVSDITGNVQKLVSRLEFSQANFSPEVIKGWSSERREGIIKESSIKKFKEKEECLENLSISSTLDSTDIKTSHSAYEDYKDLIEDIKQNFNLSEKKSPEFTKKKITYVLQPEDGESREAKAEKVSNFIENSSFYLDPKNQRTPIVEFEDRGILIRIIFKPKGGGAEDTKGDELYWAYCIALAANGREIDLPLNEEDISSFDMSKLSKDSTLKAKPSNLKGYTLGSKILCKEYLLPNHKYLVFRENCSINLINDRTYESLHSLINLAIKKVKKAKELKITKKDVWNPSDVIICEEDTYDKFKEEWEEVLNNNPLFEDLNKILLKYLKEKTVVGVSLKDTSNPRLEEENTEPEKNSLEKDPVIQINGISYPALISRRSAKDVRMEITRESDTLEDLVFQYRFFGNETMQVEGKGKSADAMLGKMPKFVLNELYAKYGVRNRELSSGDSLRLMKENPYCLLPEIECIEESSLPLHPRGEALTVDNFKNFIKNNQEENDHILGMWPRIIDFLYMLALASNKGELEKVLNALYRGTRKELEFGAPFIKLS